MLRQTFNFVTSIFLARLLTPEEFGLVGMSMVFIAFAEVFIDVGFSSALIQNQKNSELTYNSVFFINIGAGFLLTIVFYLSAPLIGRFYNNMEVVGLVRWLSLIFVFNSANLVQVAILKKKLNLKIMNVRTSIGAMIGGIAGVASAFAGLGVYSLVIQHITMAVAGTLLLWTTAGWLPKMEFSWREVKNLTGFSTYIFMDRIFSSISTRLDVLMVGKLFDPATLGFYSRASTLKDTVRKYTSTSLMKVMFPVLSEIQDDDERFKRIYYQLVGLLSFLSFGLAASMMIMGRDIILVLFGPKWEPSIIIFQILVLAVVNYPINALMVNAFLSKGKSKENFQVGILRKLIRLIPFLFAIYYGLVEFVIGLAAFNYLITSMNILFLRKYIGLESKIHFLRLYISAIPVLMVTFVYFYWDFDSRGILLRLALLLVFALFFLVYNYFLNNDALIVITDLLNKLRKKLNKKLKR